MMAFVVTSIFIDLVIFNSIMLRGEKAMDENKNPTRQLGLWLCMRI